MHITPIKEASSEMVMERDAGLGAALEMLCKRMGSLKELAEHWLRRERDKEWEQDGNMDRHLLGLPTEVNVWRGGSWPARPMKVMWWAVHIATEQSYIMHDAG